MVHKDLSILGLKSVEQSVALSNSARMIILQGDIKGIKQHIDSFLEDIL
jgi:hypothetical protein